MSQIIKIKRSTVTTAPTALANGELAYSAVIGQAQKLFIGRPGGTSGDIDVIGGKYYTDIVDAATNANTASTLVLRDASGNFSAGVVTADLSGNVTGNVTGNADTATTLLNSRNFSVTGDATAAGVGFDGSADTELSVTLVASGVTAGDYGSSTAIPTLSIDSKGRVTVAGEASITTALGIAGDSGTDTISLADDTLTFEGGTGVSTAVDSVANKVTFAIGQAVSTTSNVTFNDVTVNGQLSTDDIQAGTLTTSGNVVVEGDLTVNGTTTTVNSNTVNIGDSVITLNSDETASPTQNGGIEIERGLETNVELVWDEGDDRWQFTNSTGTHYNIPLPTEYDNYTSFNVTDGSNSTAIASGNSVTFAGTNLSVTEASGTVTYGVATATTSVKGIASFDTNYFTVTAGAVTLANVDGGTF